MNSNSNFRRNVKSKKKKASRILRPDEKQKSKETIPLRLNVYERFFASLLRSEANEYLCQTKVVWKTICDRLSLPAPNSPLPASYSNMKDHFMNRAALVAEEARQSISDGLQLLKDDFKSNERERCSNLNKKNSRLGPLNTNLMSMELSITWVEHKGKSGHSILTFSKQHTPFTRDELLCLRHGTVLACLDQKLTPVIENVILGTVVPQNREEIVSSNTFVVMVFRIIKKTIKGNWKLIPIASLLSEQRKFEACSFLINNPVPFLLPLLGRKQPTHIRRIKDTNDDTKEFSTKIKNSDGDCTESISDCEVLEIVDLEATFQIPRLNEKQEQAANAFLDSKSDTITLVQGPPGTGKTTLLTSVICRYIIESRKLKHSKRCLMVCAPTNKAVTVLFKRFLDTFWDDESFPCNVVLLGDEDKLLENENWSRTDDSFPKLRENFLYTFIDTIKEDYLYVRNVLDKGSFGLFKKVHHTARRLENRLVQKIKGRKEVLATAHKIVKLIGDLSRSRNKKYPTELINSIDFIVGVVDAWNHDDIWHEVLQAADVIFCTLGSTGGSLLKKVVGEVDDLIVDEAAAATEPEIYIPFQYLPRRLLCVGDPRQLPATITSRFAEMMGFSKSLHERLMYDCGYDHIMLETQYRMKPTLSQFPSKYFYEGKLINGGNVTRSKYQGGVSMMGCSDYTLYQIDGIERHVRSGSIENEAEANAVVKIVDNLRRISRNSGNWCSTNRIRIITFYQAQVSLIKRLLRKRNLGNVLVATVDSSQGCEADFVILSFVRSEGNGGRNTVGFLMDDRRLNVALTRAKYQIIGVGNIHRMANLPDGKVGTGSIKRLAKDAINRQCVLPFPSDATSSRRMLNSDNFKEERNKKRKSPPSECHRDHEKIFQTVDNSASNNTSHDHCSEEKSVSTSSDDSSDSDSSTTSSSSSSSSNSKSHDSRTQSSRNQHYSLNAFASAGVIGSDRHYNIPEVTVNHRSMNSSMPKSVPGLTTIGTDPVINCDEQKKSSSSNNTIRSEEHNSEAESSVSLNMRRNLIFTAASTSIDKSSVKREDENASIDEYDILLGPGSSSSTSKHSSSLSGGTKTTSKNNGNDDKILSNVESAASNVTPPNNEDAASNFSSDDECIKGQQVESIPTNSSVLSKTETMAVFEDFSF